MGDVFIESDELAVAFANLFDAEHVACSEYYLLVLKTLEVGVG
jgi:hypothetical protein